MTKDEFHASLRLYLHRRPFAPFAVDFRDGRRLVVKQPPVVFSDGGASFIDPEDGALVEFHHDEAENIGLLEQETPA